MSNPSEVKAVYVRSNAIYDIYVINGIENVEEDGEPYYHYELRNNGTTEQDITDQYLN